MGLREFRGAVGLTVVIIAGIVVPLVAAVVLGGCGKKRGHRRAASRRWFRLLVCARQLAHNFLLADLQISRNRVTDQV